jgi:hypothetical protein
MRGGSLTQERLGELLGDELGNAGYSGAAVSDWEREISKIDEDNRPVLVALVGVLYQLGGVETVAEANKLLHAGNYRALNPDERQQIFPEGTTESGGEGQVKAEIRAITAPFDRPSTQSVPEPIVSKERRKQLILLKKVERFWVEGVLEKSVHDAGLIQLAQKPEPSAVASPWPGVVAQEVHDNRPSVDNRPILDLFIDSDRSLLVLGEPGAGKTTTMLLLARKLIDCAVIDPVEPIPVVLNLVSWAEQQHSLSEWVVEELTSKYQIPRNTGRRWLRNDDLLLLLDGFDEVPARFRDGCARALNSFREERGFTGIVICSRAEAYSETGMQLTLGGAIKLESLTAEQIDGYLAAAGPQLETLRSAMGRDKTLLEMARSPLMLSIMSLAYGYDQANLADVLVEASDELETPMSIRRRHLFDTYIRRMFDRRKSGYGYPREVTQQRLAWLARQMIDQNRSPFLIERIQPSWLPSQGWRFVYMTVTGLAAGLIGGLVMWLLLQLLRETVPQLAAPVSSQMAEFLRITEGRAESVTLLMGNLGLGVVVSMLQGLYMEGQLSQEVDPEARRRLYGRHLAIVALVVFVLTMAIVTLIGDTRLGLAWGIAETVFYVMVVRYAYGRSYSTEIKTVEALSWSWPGALQGFVAGLLLAVVFEVLGWIMYGELGMTWTVVIPGVGGLILGGLRGRHIQAKSVPNQGIILSLRNAFIVGSFSAVILATLASFLRWSSYGLITGLLTFVIAGTLFGGGNVIKHLWVRALLRLLGDVPWRYARFLDYTADLVLMRKVGGSYIFMHPLLQQYFASLHPRTPGADSEAYGRSMQELATEG